MNTALRYNLGVIENGENIHTKCGQRMLALSALLPQVNAGVSENVDRLSAATMGLNTLISRL
jgi:outer membrane protein TolC